MRVLLICDDYWHPGEIVIEGATSLAQHGFALDVISDAKDFNPKILAEFPAVLMCKCDEISKTEKTPWKTQEVQKAFVNYVEGGGGLVAVHSATVAGKNTETLDKLIGCRFTSHPNAVPVTVQPVKPHPVTEGVGMFCEKDEHYHIQIIADDADVLLASYSPPQGEESKYQEDPYHNTPAAVCAAGYVREQGKGRVCVLTPGHTADVWHNIHFKKLLVNALNWCTRAAA